jgi:hypothetical protein
MAARAGGNKGLTYVAFTATPKQKTLELFGRPGDDGLPQPFHVYSMRQAIEEGFILDVLENYTPYKLAFRLAHDGKDYDETEVERSAAMKGIMQWVRLHPYNIAAKVQIVVEHYRENVLPLLAGKAKAMVVVGSRKEAVRWQKAIRGYIERQNYALGVLVAFSGEVDDPESFPAPVTETSADLNPRLKGRDIREPSPNPTITCCWSPTSSRPASTSRCCAACTWTRCWRHPGGADAVALNRAHPGKDTTYILDFVNDAARSSPRSRPTTPPPNWRRPPIRTWCSTCAPSSMPAATTTISKWSAWPGRRPIRAAPRRN